MPPSRPVVAFFDLDRTLIDVNSGRLFVRSEYRAGRISTRQMAEAMLWILLYHLSLLDIERAYNKAMSQYLGLSESLLDERSREWFGREVAPRLQPGGRAALDDHRNQGHRLVLLTNSSSYVAQVAIDTFGLDDWIANRFPTDEAGRLLGTIEPPLCYGEGKAIRARQWVEGNGFALEESYFYGDSLSDLQILEAVGHPRVVNPDPRLRRVARQRGWPILDWAGGVRVREL